MQNFFYLEGGYLVLALVILGVTLFVTTRPFMGPGAGKKGMIGMSVILAFFIGLHYYMTTERMETVKTAFEEGRNIICENRVVRKGAQFITINKSNGWELQNNNLISPAYARPFFIARCIVE